MSDLWEHEGEHPSSSWMSRPFPSTTAQWAAASVPASFNSPHASDTSSIFPWTHLHPPQEEEGTRCTRTTIKRLTASFTPRWCTRNPTTRLQALHRIPAASTCCPELNPSLSPPSLGAWRNYRPQEYSNLPPTKQNKEVFLAWRYFKVRNSLHRVSLFIRLLTWGRLRKQHLLPEPLQGSRPGVTPTGSAALLWGNPFRG